MINAQAAFTYALLRTPTALHPRSVFRRHFPLPDAPHGPETLAMLADRLESLRGRLAPAAGQEHAFWHLLIRDAEFAVTFLARHDFSDFDLEATIERAYAVAADYYRDRLGLPWTYNPPVVVDRYPPPAAAADWFAVSHVPGGPRPGHPEGIYFLRRHMMPGVAELATLHENGHLIGTGSQGRGGYYRFFDEGCCNLWAYLIYAHARGGTGDIPLYRAFLEEINTELYEYPSFDRLIGALVQRAGLGGVYRLLRQRLLDPGAIDWNGVLHAVVAGGALPSPPRGQDAPIPPIVREIQQHVGPVLALMSTPAPALLSPAAYSVYDWLCGHGATTVEEVRDRGRLTAAEADEVLDEGAARYFWARTGDRVTIMGRTDLFNGVRLVRASAC